MFSYETKIRVRYAETDRMGYVYYGNYATFYEIGRVETFRKLGISYKKLEDSGIIMPVLELKIKFIKPAKYDDLLIIKTVIRKLPSVRIYFEYEIFSINPSPHRKSESNYNKELLNVGETTLVFINFQNGKPCKPPEYFIEKIKPSFL